MEIREKTQAARRLFRLIDQALSEIPAMDSSSRMITCNILRSTNEELEETVIKLIKKSHERNSRTLDKDDE